MTHPPVKTKLFTVVVTVQVPAVDAAEAGFLIRWQLDHSLAPKIKTEAMEVVKEEEES